MITKEKIMRNLPFLVLIFIAACATPYQNSGLAGGFSETRLSENVFRVSFRANAYSRGERAEDFALLRCAELALEHGYSHFALADSKSDNEIGAYTAPTTTYTTGSAYSVGNTAYGSARTNTYGGNTTFYSKPGVTNTVVMFKGKPDIQGMVFDARFVYDSIRKKYASEFEGSK